MTTPPASPPPTATDDIPPERRAALAERARWLTGITVGCPLILAWWHERATFDFLERFLPLALAAPALAFAWIGALIWMRDDGYFRILWWLEQRERRIRHRW